MTMENNNNNNTNEVIVSNTAPAKLDLLNAEGSRSYISLKTETKEDKILLYNAMNNPTSSISDHINEKLFIENVILEEIQLTDNETGEITTAIRTVLIDPKDNSYQAVSKGVFNSIKQIISIFGEPITWVEPLEVEVKQVKVEKGSMLTLNLV